MMVLVRDDFVVHRCFDLDTSCELLWIESCTKKGLLLFATYYCPSKNDLYMLHELSMQLLLAYSLILCGDFNAPHIDWSCL